MSDLLTEEEMRAALFGTPPPISVQPPVIEPAPLPVAQRPKSQQPTRSKGSSPRLRVTLSVTKTFEGETEVFTYDASTLSSLLAEQEARAAARKKKFKYFDVVSITPI
ncbi:hypothetical protein [Pseudomonas sp. W5-36]|uniref:hypothetical protein n=1 Tax=Pseudomonas sp. W5-36 TaxID=3097455 RepID=UPI00397B4900